MIDGIDHIEGLAARGSMISSDPRLTGTFIYTANWLIDTTAGTNTEHMANILKAGTYELTTDEGSWFGEITGFGNIDLGTTCSNCGSDRVVRTGACGACLECGTSQGCS